MTNIERILESLKIIPSRYNRLAELSNISLIKLRQYVTGKKKLNEPDADRIADGIYAFIGKKVEPKSLIEEK